MSNNSSYVGVKVECPNGIIGPVTHENDEWIIIQDDAGTGEYMFTKLGCKVLKDTE